MRNKLRQHSAQLNELFFVIPYFSLLQLFSQIITGRFPATITGERSATPCLPTGWATEDS
jgi:hypothetical protein